MVQSPSWAANWFAATQEIPRISRNPKVHYRTHALHALNSQIYFWDKTLRVSLSSTVHHQEFFTVHTAMVYVIQVCLQLASTIRAELVPSWSCSLWHRPLLCVLWKTPDNGQRNCPKHVEFYSKNKWDICASSWFYYKNLSRCTVTWTSNSQEILSEVRHSTADSANNHKRLSIREGTGGKRTSLLTRERNVTVVNTFVKYLVRNNRKRETPVAAKRRLNKPMIKKRMSPICQLAVFSASEDNDGRERGTHS